ncbi:diacylglycerol kinase family protein [Virgibacillus xinjiangensis]|uniref:Diacylglycerol kinase family protein n=1 Tax=Virgibacillus xinjiangensis TaxID=393090 RepID=A0ABV7CSJ7_9BACI
MSSVWNANKKGIGFSHAWAGIRHTVKTEMNFRFHLVATASVIAAGFFLQISRLEWAVIVLAVGFVLAAEVANTAVEKLVDYLKPDIHPSAKAIKDMAAGMVLLSAISALVIGLLIFLPKLYVLFR